MCANVVCVASIAVCTINPVIIIIRMQIKLYGAAMRIINVAKDAYCVTQKCSRVTVNCLVFDGTIRTTHGFVYAIQMR